MEIIVSGTREGVNQEWFTKVLQTVHEQIHLTCLIEGGARGVDRQAREWANKASIPVVTHEANWELYGKRAGPLRSIEMLESHPSAFVLIFPGNSGTRIMDKEARRRSRNIIYATSVCPINIVSGRQR